MNVGGVLATVGAGLYTTWGLHTPSSQWIAYQAIQGIGIGLSFQVPVIVAQTSAAIADVTSATAMIFLVQCSSATVFISVAQSIFANRLVKAVTQSLPELDPRIVLATGATELRKVFPPSQLPAVLDSYMVGLRDVFIFLTVLAGVPFIISIIFLIFDRKKLDIESTEKGIGAMG